MSKILVYHKLKRFTQLSYTEKKLFVEALVFSFAAKILLLFVPFRYWQRILSNQQSTNGKPDIEQLRQIKKAMHRTRWLAFWKNQCIVMAVASRWMLHRRHISSVFSLGVAFDENRKLRAHAWLITNDLDVVEKGGNFLELYHF